MATFKANCFRAAVPAGFFQFQVRRVVQRFHFGGASFRLSTNLNNLKATLVVLLKSGCARASQVAAV